MINSSARRPITRHLFQQYDRQERIAMRAISYPQSLCCFGDMVFAVSSDCNSRWYRPNPYETRGYIARRLSELSRIRSMNIADRRAYLRGQIDRLRALRETCASLP